MPFTTGRLCTLLSSLSCCSLFLSVYLFHSSVLICLCVSLIHAGGGTTTSADADLHLTTFTDDVAVSPPVPTSGPLHPVMPVIQKNGFNTLFARRLIALFRLGFPAIVRTRDMLRVAAHGCVVAETTGILVTSFQLPVDCGIVRYTHRRPHPLMVDCVVRNVDCRCRGTRC